MGNQDNVTGNQDKENKPEDEASPPKPVTNWAAELLGQSRSWPG